MTVHTWDFVTSPGGFGEFCTFLSKHKGEYASCVVLNDAGAHHESGFCSDLDKWMLQHTPIKGATLELKASPASAPAPGHVCITFWATDSIAAFDAKLQSLKRIPGRVVVCYTTTDGQIFSRAKDSGEHAAYTMAKPIHGTWTLNIPETFGRSLAIERLEILGPALKTAEPVPSASRFPHNCPRCKGPAYIGFTTIECERKCV